MSVDSLEGVEPVVQLQMEDGGLLINSDPLSIIIQMGTPVIEAKVLSWNVSSIVTFYEEACQALNTRKYFKINLFYLL